jgi:hypothetical protein
VQVAQHLVLAVDAMEDRVGEEIAGAPGGAGEAEVRGGGQGVDALGRDLAAAEGLEDPCDVFACRRLVEGDAHRSVAVVAQVDAALAGRGEHRAGAPAGGRHPQRVEERSVPDVVPPLLEPFGEGGGKGVHASCYAAQAVGPVPHRVHARHDGEQHLGGADVARRTETPTSRPGSLRAWASQVDR